MLIELKIKNFAIARDLEIAFREGFNVLTGESGAGKSIIIESLNFVTGGRIKTARVIGNETAWVQAAFSTEDLEDEIKRGLIDSGLLNKGEEHLIFTRRLYPNGRNTYQINGAMVNLGFYQEAARSMIDIHGQRDNQYLLSVKNQRTLLDRAAGKDASALLADIARLYGEYKETEAEIERLALMERERKRRIDWLRFEIGEIEDAKTYIGEDEELEKLKKIMENRERILILSRTVHELLSGEKGALDSLSRASASLVKWGEIDPDVLGALDIIDESVENLKIAASIVRDKSDEPDFDPAMLDQVINRLHLLDRLKQKYGRTIEEVLEYAEASKKNLQELEESEEKAEVLAEKLMKIAAQWERKAQLLSDLRKKTAAGIKKEVEKELADLGMEHASFSITLKTQEGESAQKTEKNRLKISVHGADEVEFMLRTNPGESEKPLSLIASGGELSRVMLALKNVFARFRGFSTLVLDEIDVGLGGLTAESVGRKLMEISRHRQVICVTHLPVIAAMANAHFQIEKMVADGGVRTTLTPISGKDRVEEVARMIAGAQAPGETRKAAEKMLKGKNH